MCLYECVYGWLEYRTAIFMNLYRIDIYIFGCILLLINLLLLWWIIKMVPHTRNSVWQSTRSHCCGCWQWRWRLESGHIAGMSRRLNECFVARRKNCVLRVCVMCDLSGPSCLCACRGLLCQIIFAFIYECVIWPRGVIPVHKTLAFAIDFH